MVTFFLLCVSFIFFHRSVIFFTFIVFTFSVLCTVDESSCHLKYAQLSFTVSLILYFSFSFRIFLTVITKNYLFVTFSQKVFDLLSAEILRGLLFLFVIARHYLHLFSFCLIFSVLPSVQSPSKYSKKYYIHRASSVPCCWSQCFLLVSVLLWPSDLGGPTGIRNISCLFWPYFN